MKEVSLCILRRADEVLLGKILNNSFQGEVHNFPGGNKEGDETLEQCACRELREETGVEVDPSDLEKIAEITFLWPETKAKHNQVVHVYISRKWKGEPKTTKELDPYWCRISDIPYNKMWKADERWIPCALAGKYFTAEFKYDEKKELVGASINF